jgi:WD40 repeat protein
MAFAAIAFAPGVVHVALSQTPQLPRIPTPDEVWKRQQEMSGKAPLAASETAGGVQVVFQTGHAGIISSVAMSADGRSVLSASWDETAKLWDVASGQELRTITGLNMTGGGVAFVSGAERLVVHDYTGARLIDLATGRALRELGGIGTGAALSGNARFAATRVMQDDAGRRSVKLEQISVLSIVDLARDQVAATLNLRGQAAPLAVSNDGQAVVVRRLDSVSVLRMSADPQWQTEIWDIAANKLRSRFTSGDGGAESLSQALSPDGRLFAVSGLGKVRIYSTADGQQQLELSTGDALSAASVLFSPDGRLLASYAYTGDSSRPGVHIWEIPSGRAVTSFDASAVNFSADGRTLIVGRQSGGAPALRDLQTGKESPLAGGTSAVVDLAVIANGSSVVAATEFGGLRHWDLRTGQLLRSFDCPGGTGTRSVSASSSGPWLAASCNDGGVYVWNVQNGELVRTLNPPAPGKYGVMATVRFDPSGRRVALGINEQLAVWDVIEGRELRRLTLPRNESPLMAGAGSLEGAPAEVRQQYAEQLERYGMTQQQEAEWRHGVRALAFHPGGRYVAVAKMDASTLLVDIDSGQVVRRLQRGTLSQSSLAQQPDASAQSAMLQQLLGGRGLSRRQKKALEEALRKAGMQGDAADTAILQSRDDLLDEFDMVASLAFTPDGQRLFTLGTRGQRTWDVESGSPIEQSGPAMTGGMDPNSLFGSFEIPVDYDRSSGIAVTADGRLAAHGHGNRVKVWDVSSKQDLADLSGHTSDVTAVVYAANARLLVSGSRDGTLRIWSVPQRRELVQLIALGASDYVAVTPDQYYRASKRHITGVAFRVNQQLYPFEQFDLRFNRPDIVLERLGSTPAEVVQSYRAAYQRRLRKMGFTEQMLSGEFHLPDVALVGANVPATTEAASLKLSVRASDAEYALDRINAFVNDVPVFSTAGLKIADPQAHSHEQEVEVPLVPGRNKIQVSVLNAQGTESLKQTAYTTSTADPGTPDVYVLAIGVSRYRNAAYNLRFAAKDAADLIAAYRDGGGEGAVHVLDLTNEKATRTSIREARNWLSQAGVNDLVVVFAAGHGMTDARQNYFFGTHDIDPERPELNGLPYEDFEALLDGIRAMRKVLLIDTCFSGEIDKDESIVVAEAQADGAGTVSMRAFKAARGVSVVADETAPEGSTGTGSTALSGDVLRFQQELFADLRRGTGAVVISSASGNEYALEGEQWSNGVFTYALLNGLKNARADANQDGSITVSELQAHVIEEVRSLTAGGQNPTVRRENLDYDFVVY